MNRNYQPGSPIHPGGVVPLPDPPEEQPWYDVTVHRAVMLGLAVLIWFVIVGLFTFAVLVAARADIVAPAPSPTQSDAPLLEPMEHADG